MLLYVGNNVVDLSEDNPISLNYDLNNDRDLSAFTTTYSSELVLPLTRGNSVIFGHPSVGNVGGYYDYYILGDDGAKVDEGSLVVDYVDDDAVHCHLYGSVVSLNDAMSGCSSMKDLIDGDSLRDASGVSHSVNFYNPLTEDYDVAYVPVLAENFYQFDDDMGASISGDTYGDRGFLYFNVTNIGIPNDFDSSHIWQWNGTELVPVELGREHTVLEMGDGNDYQYRPYQLQPYVRVGMLMQNIIHYAANRGFTLSMSSSLNPQLFNRLVYLTPKLNKVYVSDKSSTSWNHPTFSSTTAGTTASLTGYTNGLTIRGIMGNLGGGSFGFKTSDTTYRVVYYIVTVSDGVNSTDVLVYGSGDTHGADEDFYKSIKKSKPSYDVAYGWGDGGDLKLSLASDSSTTYSLSYKTVVVEGSISKKAVFSVDSVTTYNYAADVQLLGALAVSTFNSVSMNVADALEKSGYMSFSYASYFEKVDKPWDIVKKICKKFNIRLRPKSLKEWEFVLGSEYYDSVADISDIVDYTDSKTNAFVFPYKKILFADEPTDASWVKGYEAIDSKVPYGGKAYVNKEYPVEDTKKWFEDPMKYTTSAKFIHGTYGKSGVTDVEYPIIESCDKDAKEVDISGCLVILDSGLSGSGLDDRGFIITDDRSSEDSQCYYYFPDLYDDSGVPQSVIGRKSMWLNCIINTGVLSRQSSLTSIKGQCVQKLNYGESVASPNGVMEQGYLLDYFKDIIDSLKSSSFECGVFLNKYPNSIQKFIHTIHYFDNQYWVVGSISSYNPSSVDAARVRFIKVMDLDNYMTTEYFTISASSEDVSKGSVSPVSQSVRKGFDATVVATPATGYEFEGWYKSGNRIAGAGATYTFNVSGDVSLVAKFAVRKVTINASSVRGSISATYGGSPIVLPATLDIGSQVTVSLAVPYGYEFVKWVDRASSSEYVVNPVTVTLSDDMNLVAETRLLSGNLSIDCSPVSGAGYITDVLTHEPIQVPYSSTIEVGEDVVLNASAAPGYSFKWWTINGVQQAIANPTIPVTMPTEGLTLVAVFESIVPTHTVSVDVIPSGVGVVSGAGTYAEGTTCVLRVESHQTGYAFTGWYKDNVLQSVNQWYQFTVTEDVTYEARFGGVSYTIAAVAGANGEVSIDNGVTWSSGTVTAVYADGSQCTIKARGNSGYDFAKWTDENGGEYLTADYSFTVSASSPDTYTASFVAAASYTITTSSSPALGGSTTGGGSYALGSSCTVVATANEGYRFVEWREGFVAVSSSASYTFTVSANRTLIAVFDYLTYQLNYSSSTSIDSLTVYYASGEYSGEEYTLGDDVLAGTSLRVDVVPNQFITDWYNSLTSTRLSVFPLSFTLVMNENITLQAVFTTTSNLTVITSTDGTVDVEFEDYPDYGTQVVDDVEDFLVPTGSNVILTATAISPATFDEWITDGSYYGSENPLVFEGGDYAEVEATYVSAPADNYLTFTKSAGASTATANVYLRRTSTDPGVNCEYSTDGGTTWTAMPQSTSASYTGYVSFTDTMLVRGTNASGFSKSASQFARFVFGGSGSGVRVTLSGALTSLIDGHGYSSTTMPNDYCFYGLFMKGTDGGTTNDTRITTTVGLVFPGNVTTMCYANMFYRATNLTNAGFTLPVTKCGIGYDETQSFSQNDCYARMFAYCTSLVSTPDVKSTDMGVGICAQMFMGCTALSNIPSWVANVTKWGVYAGGEMFKGCTSLSSNIMLQADTCWQAMWFQMFYGCSTITNAIVDVLNIIPPTTGSSHMGGLAQMFMNCGNLNGVDVSTTGYVDGEGLTDWLSGVSDTGDITVQDGTAASWAGLYPEGWTLHEV